MCDEITIERNGFYAFRRGFPSYTKSVFKKQNEIVTDDKGTILGVTNPEKFLFVTVPPTDGEVQILEIGKRAFSSCDRLRSIVFSDNLEIIGEEAFYNSSSLSSISLPDSVYEIGEGAFEKTAIRNFVFPRGIEYCAPRIFMDDISLESVTLGDNIKRLGILSFAGCTHLRDVNLPKKLEEIPDGAFMSSGIREITLPGSIRRIGNAAFSSCRMLSSIYYDGRKEDFRRLSFGRSWNRGMNRDCALYLKNDRGEWYNAFDDNSVKEDKNEKLDEALSLLGFDGIPKERELKEAYHKKASAFHPDRLSSLGLDEEFTHFAEEKFRAYKSAYDIILEYIERKGEH